MKTTVYGRIRKGSLAAILSVAVVFGCQGKQLTYAGATATQKDNVAIEQGGPHEGRWEDSNIIVNYSYTNQADGFEFTGTIELTSRLHMTFRTVRGFSVHANFLDEEKKILTSTAIVSTGNQAIRVWRFARNFDLPRDARWINFSYSGRAMEGGTLGRGGDGADMFFWRVP